MFTGRRVPVRGEPDRALLSRWTAVSFRRLPAMFQIRRRTLPRILGGLALVAFAATALPAEEPDLSPGRDYEFEGDEAERAMAIQKQFQDAGTELAETHAEAVKHEELQKPLQELSDAMKAEMLRLAPERKAEIERRYEVHRTISRLGRIEQPTDRDREEFEAAILEYSNLTEALDDLPKRAAKAPSMRRAREKFEAELLAVMTRINPRVPDLMKQQQTSVAEYNDLTIELMRRRGGVPVELAPTPALPAVVRPRPTPSS